MTIDSSIESKLSASAYLSQLRAKAKINVEASATDLADELVAIISTMQAQLPAYTHDAEQSLLQAKTDFTMAWSLAELQSVLSPEERGRLQTQFAEASIDYALRLAWVSVGSKQKVIANALEKAKGKLPGLFVFGTGKISGSK